MQGGTHPRALSVWIASKLRALYVQRMAEAREKKYIGEWEGQTVTYMSERPRAGGEIGNRAPVTV